MPPEPAPVVCLGDVMVDLLARLPGPLARGSDTPARIAAVPGGSGANTAAWLATAGASAVMAGRVGDDEFGRSAVAALTAAGVVCRLAVDPQRATGVCIVLVGPDGERTMIPDAGANAGLRPADLPLDLLRAGAALHVSAYTLLRDSTREPARAAIDAAVAAGGRVSVDAASAAPLAEVDPARFLSWLPAGATLFANADEAAVLTDAADPAAAAGALADLGVLAVVKAGPRGAYAGRPGDAEVLHCPARPSTLVDSTGAGDAFAAGFLAADGLGAALDDALRAGARLAATAVAALGARPPRAGA